MSDAEPTTCGSCGAPLDPEEDAALIQRDRVTARALEDADRQLGLLEDAIQDVDGTIPPWLTAARWAVRRGQEVVNDGS